LTYPRYPNPTDGIITIVGENINKIIVTDINGKIIKQKLISGKVSTIDLTENPNGIYFVKVETKNETLIKKIIKGKAGL